MLFMPWVVAGRRASIFIYFFGLSCRETMWDFCVCMGAGGGDFEKEGEGSLHGLNTVVAAAAARG